MVPAMATRKRASKKPSASQEAANALLPAPSDPNALYLIDISGYIFRAYHAMPPLSNSQGEPTHAVAGVANMLFKLMKERSPHMLAVALDSRAGSFRRDLYPKYKANRPPPPEDLASQIERVKELIAGFEIPAFGLDAHEADDVIATVAAWAEREGIKLVIVSADKDLLQLVSPTCVMYDTMREKVFGVDETVEKFGVPPTQVRDLLALMGDSSDNVPGVPGVGPKTAATLLKEHGSFDDIFKALPTFTKKKLKEKLEANEELARVSRELVSLRAEMDLPLDRANMVFNGGDPVVLRDLFLELEFTRLLSRIGSTPIAAGRYEVVTDVDRLRDITLQIQHSGEVAVRTVLTAPDDDPHRGTLIGIAISWTEGLAAYIPFGHRYIGVPDQLDSAVVLETLRPCLENSLLKKVCGNLKREIIALRRHGMELRGGSFDVMLASYLLDPHRRSHEIGAVALEELDVTLTKLDKARLKFGIDQVEVEAVMDVAAQQADYALRLGHLLTPRMGHGDFQELFFNLELPLVSVLADLELTGIAINASLLEEMSAEAADEILELTALAHQLAGRKFNTGSPRQLEGILFDELDLPVLKRTKTARSTDVSVLEELAGMHDLPGVILDLRTLTKLKGTYLDALPLARDKETGRVHTKFNQAVAATGRLSSSDPNLQNIPIRTELGRRIRNAFIPSVGNVMMAADYSQIELRVLGHLSQDPELIGAYRDERDVHVMTAMALYDVDDPEEITRAQRGAAKTVNFAVIYGQTRFALAKNLRITKTEAQRYIDTFFDKYAGVKRFMDEVVQEAKDTGHVTTMLGRRRSVADIRSKNPALRNGAERIARNTPIQGTAADIIKIAMIEVQRALRGLESKMLLSVHDELVFDVAPSEKTEVEKLVRREMMAAHELSIPLVVDVGWGPHWGAAH